MKGEPAASYSKSRANLMQQTALFDMLYGLVAAKGRESTLLGSGVERARSAFRQFSIPCNELHLYFEIPLAGAPDFDVLIGMNRTEAQAAIAAESDIGKLETLTRFHAMASTGGRDDALLGFELDARTPALDLAGTYLVQRDHSEMVEPFLEAAGETDRLSSWMEFQNRLPRRWTTSYVGLFPHRPKSPLRVNAHPMADASDLLLEKGPSSLNELLDGLGYESTDDSLARKSFETMSYAHSWDLQFDLYGEGELGDTLGLELYFGNMRPEEARATFRGEGKGAHLLRTFEEWGLADKRWEQLADAQLAKRLTIPLHGSTEEFLVGVHLFSAKVKFRCGIPNLAKFYIKADVIPS